MEDEIFAMMGGDGPNSYAKNSYLQVRYIFIENLFFSRISIKCIQWFRVNLCKSKPLYVSGMSLVNLFLIV